MDKKRESRIIRTSIVGILVNLILSGAKATVGFLTGSIAIALDAVNNTTDALSSVITIVGAKIASKEPDKEHPLGHGRVEYVSATLIAVIILYAGITALVESVQKIITPTQPSYTQLSVIIISSTIAVKIILGLYVLKVGKKVDSDALQGSGKDALWDAVIAASTVAAALIYIFTNVSTEAYVGIGISLFIIRSGIEMIRETVSKIMGERVEGSFSRAIKETICSVDEVLGAYDLILNNYGPGRYVASAHIEVNSELKASKIDRIIREIDRRVMEKHGVIVGGISIYAVETTDKEILMMQLAVMKKVTEHPHVIQMHAFFADLEDKKIRFDAVVDFNAPDKEGLQAELIEAVSEMYPGFDVGVCLDEDVSD